MIEGNLIIRASAGTGKTYSLATRFIRLMLFDDVNPARIVALTFSRAAAQEIYTKILERLWKAAASEDGAAEEKTELLKGLGDKLEEIEKKKVDWSAAGFARLLRQVVDTQNVGAIATLDSFILRIVRNFPLEMGFQRAVEVLDEHGEGEAVRQAVHDILSGTEDERGFAEAFRTARKGQLPRVLATALDYMLSNEGWRKFILAHPESKTWTAESMAKELCLAEASGFSSVEELALSPFLSSLEDKKSEAYKNLKKFAEYLASFKAGENPIPSGTSIAVEFAQAVARHPDKPYFIHIKKNRDGSKEEVRIDYPQEVFDAARKDLSRLADAYLREQLNAVAAKLKLFSFIEAEYDASTRKAGKLTFSDFTDYSAKNEGTEKELAIENLEFRFDSIFDHWALDEFQDTSEIQWRCLKRLVESAASPDSGGRTVVTVGDLKQSIYTWRGGNDAPFKEMMGWPSFQKPFGEPLVLDISFRYQKNICDFVNSVFGPDNIRDGGILPPARSKAIERWLGKDCWCEHKPENDKDNKPKANDYVKVIGVRQVSDLQDGRKTGFEWLLPALERELRPIWDEHERVNSDETVGILVRTNDAGIAAAQYLRSKGFPVVWEGMNAISDVPAVKAVVNLLRLADHPEDVFAWKFVNDLLPVRRILFPDVEKSYLASKIVASDLSKLGIARALKEYCGKLCENESLDDLSKMRLRALVRAAVDYERENPADYGIDGFIRFLDDLARRENGDTPRVIRILTIHRSKGLTLDRVFVPIWESDESSIAEPGKNAIVFGAGKSWVLPHLPADVACVNDAVSEVIEEQRDEQVLVALRTNYVALTRARKALYVIQPADAIGVHFRSLVAKAKIVRDYQERMKEATGDSGVFGEDNDSTVLFEQGTAPAFSRPKQGPASAKLWSHVDAAEPIRRRSPSTDVYVEKDAGTSFAKASSLFKGDFGSSARHGTDEHAAFAEIEWIDSAAPKDDRERQILAWGGKWREAFRETPGATVWRERSYELLFGDTWETGQFDRVVFRVEDGKRKAEIYDFKTNANQEKTVDSFEKKMWGKYAGQMADYRRAVARLTGIPEADITATLLLTSTGTTVKNDTVEHAQEGA